MSAYNIIWADDEIDRILDDRCKKMLIKKDFNLVGIAHNAHELESVLEANKLLVDAVIVDANFNEFGRIGSPQDTSGLDYARSLYRIKYAKKIPFFLFTNRSDELLRTKYADNPAVLNEDFPRHQRWFSKSIERPKMLAKIKETVDFNRTPLGKLRQKYPQEFDAAAKIPGAAELLVKGLLFDFDDSANTESTEYYFNPLRMIWEKIESECKANGWLPKISKLNSMADFLQGREVEGYKMTVPIMPAVLAHSLKYFLSITQDGSHTKDDLKLKVIEYVRDKKNSNLYRSVLFIAMDLLIWYNTYEAPDTMPWKLNFQLIGEAKAASHNPKWFYLDRFSLLPKEGEPIEAGDLIGIRDISKAIDNRTPYKGSIMKEGVEEEINVDKAIRSYDYEILVKSISKE